MKSRIWCTSNLKSDGVRRVEIKVFSNHKIPTQNQRTRFAARMLDF